MTFEQVYDHILDFLSQSPYSEYRLSIGTDSQVTKHTLFATAIHLHRIGKGAIGFITRQVIPRPISSLREKIYYETSKTMEVAALFTPEKMDGILDILFNPLSSYGDIYFEFHLDIGAKGATRDLINEMVSMASATPFEPKIKPDSYAASSYANRYTKYSDIYRKNKIR
jgi:predicted RNase H-related nuclease YkuK (DUF458 family)